MIQKCTIIHKLKQEKLENPQPEHDKKIYTLTISTSIKVQYLKNLAVDQIRKKVTANSSLWRTLIVTHLCNMLFSSEQVQLPLLSY